jgi:hypothetical protein
MAAPAENRCGLCPTTPEEVARFPPAPPLDDDTLSHLRCGHSVHTHCLLNSIYDTSITEIQCAICHLHVATPEARAHYRNWGRARHADRDRAGLQELWDTNAEFKTDVLAYKVISRKFGKASRQYKPELRQIQERFKQNILTSLESIKMQKQQAIQDVRRLASNKMFKSAGASLERKTRSIERKYNLGRWGLDDLANITGAPKIAQHRYYRWRSNTAYLFRIRM